MSQLLCHEKKTNNYLHKIELNNVNVHEQVFEPR